MVFVSQVFFNSGYALARPSMRWWMAVARLTDSLVIDGYHAFLALPVDLRSSRAGAFYLAGGYKYAMAGEGACFMHCPPGFAPRPRNTGWYASFATLVRAAGSRSLCDRRPCASWARPSIPAGSIGCARLLRLDERACARCGQNPRACHRLQDIFLPVCQGQPIGLFESVAPRGAGG